MPVVSELVAHILAHVNAEDDADPADESHVANFGRRAQLVRDAAASLRADGSDVTLRAFCDTGTLAEGVVGKTLEPLFDRRGKRLILKLKTKDFS